MRASSSLHRLPPQQPPLHLVVTDEQALIRYARRTTDRTDPCVCSGKGLAVDLDRELHVPSPVELPREDPVLVAERAALERGERPLRGLERPADEEDVLGAEAEPTPAAIRRVGELEPGVEVVPHVADDVTS